MESITVLGGTGYDRAYVLALDTQGAVTVAGLAESPNFPTTPGAFDTSQNGSWDALVTRIDMIPTGVSPVPVVGVELWVDPGGVRVAHGEQQQRRCE